MSERDHVARLAVRAAGNQQRLAVLHRLLRPGQRHCVAVDLLALERRQHAGGRHRRYANVVRIDARARRHQPHIGVDHRIDGIHRDGAALEQRAALLQRRLGIIAAGLRDLFSQHHLRERPVNGGGDGNQLLSARAGAAERACRGLREMRAAGNHRVDGADPGDRHRLHLDAVLGPQVEIARDIAGGEGQAERRIGQDDLLVRLGMQWRDARD